MKRYKSEIKVVTGYNGLPGYGTVVEVIERTRIVRTPRKRQPYYLVSYKGKMEQVFTLPSCYGDLAGACIEG